MPAAGESPPYPAGVGVILFGGRHNVVENNRIHGNYLGGVAAIQQFLLEDPSAKDLIGNQVEQHVRRRRQRPQRPDLVYDGNGRDDCFGPTPA